MPKLKWLCLANSNGTAACTAVAEARRGLAIGTGMDPGDAYDSDEV